MKRLSAVVMGLSIVSFGAFLSPTPVKAENCVNAAAKGGGRGTVIGGVAGGAFGAGAGAAAGTSVGGPAGTVGGAVGGAEVGSKMGAAAGGTAGMVGAGADCAIEEATGVSPYKESVEAGNEAVNEAEEQLRKLPF